MKAKTILTQSTVQNLTSPYVVLCPSCKHEVTVDKLCYCHAGHVYCGMASNGCKASCPCDEYGDLYDAYDVYDDDDAALPDAPDEEKIKRQAREKVKADRLTAITTKWTFDA